MPCEAVDAAARKVIVDAGYGPDYKFFTHRVGHGMGMDGHEWPYLVRGNKLPLAPGMTFSDEPGIYIRGEFGVRLEDDMVITETGAELFTPQSRSLEAAVCERAVVRRERAARMFDTGRSQRRGARTFTPSCRTNVDEPLRRTPV